MKKKKLPFKLMPGSWGLKGKSRDIAEAEYYLEGSELEKRLVDINQTDPVQAQLAKLDIALKYREITPLQQVSERCKILVQQVEQETADPLDKELRILNLRRNAEEISQKHYLSEKSRILQSIVDREVADPKLREIKKIDIQLEYEEITPAQYTRKAADINQEPFVNVVDIGVNPDGAATGYLELDWNDEFVKMLQENGYTGTSDDAIVNKWFNNVCRTILIQEQADLDYGMETENAPTIRTISKD